MAKSIPKLELTETMLAPALPPDAIQSSFRSRAYPYASITVDVCPLEPAIVTISLSHATPAIPMPLLACAAAIPATCVPWLLVGMDPSLPYASQPWRSST